MSNSSGQQTSSSSISISNYILLPILSLTDIFAVAYIIIVLSRSTLRNNKLNWFTINICLTSILQSTAMLQSTLRQLFDLSTVFSCRLLTYISVVGASQIMYSHVVTAISRFLAIVYANKHVFRSTPCALLFIFSGWLIGFVIVIPYVIIDGFGCSSPTNETFLPYYTITVLLIIPATSVSICNTLIFLFVRQSSRRVHTEAGRANPINTRDLRLIKTMIVTFVVFFSGWAPLFIEQTFISMISVSKTVDQVFQVLPSISMLVDVLLLIYTNQPMRTYLWQLVKRQRQPPAQTTVK